MGQKIRLGLKQIVYRESFKQKFACRSVQKLSKLDFTDFYYRAEQEFVSLVTSLFKNSVRSVQHYLLDSQDKNYSYIAHRMLIVVERQQELCLLPFVPLAAFFVVGVPKISPQGVIHKLRLREQSIFRPLPVPPSFFYKLYQISQTPPPSANVIYE